LKSGWLRIGYPATGGVSFPVEHNINIFIPLKTILTWLTGDAAIRSLLRFPTRHRCLTAFAGAFLPALQGPSDDIFGGIFRG
jgi:hypothetical protein